MQGNTQISDAMVEAAVDAYMSAATQGGAIHAWMRAALSAALAGHVVVPREPTQEIIQAVEKTLSEDVLPDYRYTLPDNGADLLYRAMISAAPPAQREG